MWGSCIHRRSIVCEPRLSLRSGSHLRLSGFSRVGPGPRPGPQSCDGLKVADLACRVFTGNTQLCISGQIWFLYENPSQAHNYKYTQMHIHERELGADGRVCVQCTLKQSPAAARSYFRMVPVVFCFIMD